MDKHADDATNNTSEIVLRLTYQKVIHHKVFLEEGSILDWVMVNSNSFISHNSFEIGRNVN